MRKIWPKTIRCMNAFRHLLNTASGLGTGGTCLARIDLEPATEHYRGRNLAEKVRAGFSIYAHAQDAPGLRRVLDQHELTAEILSL